MIGTSNWKEFRVGDLFEVTYGIFKAKSESIDEGGIPHITTTQYNNGIGYYVKEQMFPSHCITVASDGCQGASFYHTYPISASNIVSVCVPHNDVPMNEIIGNFLCSLFRKEGEKYSWGGFKYSVDRVRETRLHLPVTSDGQPDWTYMESYMKSIMEESEKSLENLRKANDTKHLIDVSGWGEFDITKFFTVLSGRTKLSNADIDDGDTPVYSSNSTNGGVFGYTTKSPDYEVNDENPFYITFGDHTKAVNIADRSFCVMDNVKVLTSNIRNYDVLHFIITSWLKNVPDLGYARHWSEAEKAKIWLPITSAGEPDWAYMESYMRDRLEEAEKVVAALN